MTTPTPFPERLAEIVSERGLVPAKISRDIGLSPNFVRDIIVGRARSPKADNLAKLAQRLGMSLDDLVRGTDLETPATGLASSHASFAHRSPPTHLFSDHPPAEEDDTDTLLSLAGEQMRLNDDIADFFLLKNDRLLLKMGATPRPNQLVVLKHRSQPIRLTLHRFLPPYLLNPGRTVEYYDDLAAEFFAVVVRIERDAP